ncbi:MAG: DUF4783 domain-containing protein [Bacteroidales bacterium]|nr:DUF4783 domain-containing protein [Bacteroidales bacterium]
MMRMKVVFKYFIFVCGIFSAVCTYAQKQGFDVFNPIAKYISQGNVDSLSPWLADNLEISIFSETGDVSKNQAKWILKSFFDSYSPRSFTIDHTAGKGNMKYALGTLNAGGEKFFVTLFVNFNGKKYTIQQLKIERIH